ncbi:MAG: transcription-repair coupling factor [Erysipelotrichaceae bacterium]
MNIIPMINVLNKLNDLKIVDRFINKEPIANLSINQQALVIAGAFALDKKNYLIVENNLYQAKQLYNHLSLLVKETYLYGCEESLRVDAVASSIILDSSRLDTLNTIVYDNSPKIIVAHTMSLLRYLPKVDVFKSLSLSLRVNSQYKLSEIKSKLIDLGYISVSKVDQPLSFAFRGSIIDIFISNYDYPVRIEFFDNEIESIRFFDVISQSTISSIHEINVALASDLIFSNLEINNLKEKTSLLINDIKDEDKRAALALKVSNDLDDIMNHNINNQHYLYRTFLDNDCILDYFDGCQVVFNNYQQCLDSYKLNLSEGISYIQELYSENSWFLLFTNYHPFEQLLDKYDYYNIDDFNSSSLNINNEIIDLNLSNDNLQVKLQYLIKQYENIVLVLSDEKLEHVIQTLVDLKIEYSLSDESAKVLLVSGKLAAGFVLDNISLSVVSEKELFNVKSNISKYEEKFKQALVIDDYQQLEYKDYVVHYQYGIGQYLGIVNKEIQGVKKDFLHVIYRNNASLYVPLEQFHLIRKFVGREGAVAKLSKLGSNEWSKTKEKLAQNAQEIASELIEIYALRKKEKGFAFSADTLLQKQFEDDFDYDLTVDQKQAVLEIKEDMESEYPMDRLLCGDVGFGKTEVAIRAAFKAVLDNKQVALLCPTTILSFQHYQTFKKRMDKYGVNVAIVNRFVSIKDQHDIFKKLEQGEIDVLIGTHRLLSKEIKYRDLGLLIIDEEQRFGVMHKEKIKKLRSNVDVLALSATPIPRTLQMSLVGIRSLSLLNTPPNNRLSVQTYVMAKNMDVVKEVIQRELARNGQVFFLHNNVNTIYLMAEKVRKLVPDAKIAIIHGQMDKEEIENVMYKFVNDEYDVLVCTTIIETGIDIPNVNTIIVDNATNFGLSQLYQIKGRVGRSNVLAYAYLLYDGKKSMSEVASKRLKAIKDFTRLGSGYKIAMRDLTIRGAGDLLGVNQSGFIDTVGIDMYMEILEDAIKQQKGEKVESREIQPKANMVSDISGYIPKQFTNQDFEKLQLYQKIEKAENYIQLEFLLDKTTDYYGKLPKEVGLLFEKKELELLLRDSKVASFEQKNNQAILSFSDEYYQNMNGVKFFEIITNISKDIKFSVKGGIQLMIPYNIDWLKATIEILKKV